MESVIEWFWKTIKNTEPSLEWYKIIEQAKDLETKQAHDYAKFAIECDRRGMKILNFDDWLKLETFKPE